MFFSFLVVIPDKINGDNKVYFQNLDVSIAMCLKPPLFLLYSSKTSLHSGALQKQTCLFTYICISNSS